MRRYMLGVDRALDFRARAGSGGLGLCIFGLGSGSGLGPIMKLNFGQARALYFRARVGLRPDPPLLTMPMFNRLLMMFWLEFAV